MFAVLGLGIVEGVLPLHLSSQLSQPGIGVLYAAMSVVVAIASALAARLRPRHALVAALALIVVGITVAGVGHQVPVWALALAVAGVGIGLANTGSIGVLLEGVPTDRIVTAMVVWSQVGIVGYFIGPLAGGFVAQTAGYQALGLVPLWRPSPCSSWRTAPAPTSRQAAARAEELRPFQGEQRRVDGDGEQGHGHDHLEPLLGQDAEAPGGGRDDERELADLREADGHVTPDSRGRRSSATKPRAATDLPITTIARTAAISSGWLRMIDGIEEHPDGDEEEHGEHIGERQDVVGRRDR